MAKENFLYADFVQHAFGDQTNFLGGFAQPSKHYQEVDKSSFTLRKYPSFIKKFNNITRCVYCKAQLTIDRREIPLEAPQAWGTRGTFYGSFVGAKCYNCNWWYIQRNGTIDDDERDVIDNAFCISPSIYS